MDVPLPSPHLDLLLKDGELSLGVGDRPHRFLCSKINARYSAPWKIKKVEPKNEGLEDDVPFQKDDSQVPR